MTIAEILGQYGHYIFAIILLFGGRWGVKYFDVFRRTAHNFLLFATAFGLLFILFEVLVGAFKKEQLSTLLLTYCVVTSSWELVFKHVFPSRKK